LKGTAKNAYAAANQLTLVEILNVLQDCKLPVPQLDTIIFDADFGEEKTRAVRHWFYTDYATLKWTKGDTNSMTLTTIKHAFLMNL